MLRSVPRSSVKAAHPSLPAPLLWLYSGPGSAPRLPCLAPALVAASYFWSLRKLQGGGSTVHGASVDLGGAASWRLCPWSWGGRVSGIRGASHCSGGHELRGEGEKRAGHAGRSRWVAGELAGPWWDCDGLLGTWQYSSTCFQGTEGLVNTGGQRRSAWGGS